MILIMLISREHPVHAPAPAQGQVLDEQVGDHRAADRAGHGVPPPPGHRAQGPKDQEHLPRERPRHHRRLRAGQRGEEAVRQACRLGCAKVSVQASIQSGA